jgi:hypothetical protein
MDQDEAHFHTVAVQVAAHKAKLGHGKLTRVLCALRQGRNYIGKSIPEEEWDKVPTDLAANLGHYLYGEPKERGQ